MPNLTFDDMVQGTLKNDLVATSSVLRALNILMETMGRQVGGELEPYLTGTGQLVFVHPADRCAGTYCGIHRPQPSGMETWPTHWRPDRMLLERICPHGCGHPDPDHLEDVMRKHGAAVAMTEATHGCDGCCSIARMTESAG